MSNVGDEIFLVVFYNSDKIDIKKNVVHTFVHDTSYKIDYMSTIE